MAKIYVPSWDENFVRSLKDKGLGVPNAPHWIVARLALARSLQLPQFPDEELRRPLSMDRAYSIHMEQLTGENSPSQEDYTDVFRLMLAVYHQEDCFSDRDRFIELLQRHIQRGLLELQRTWREGHDFHDYLYQELFFERTDEQPAVDGEAESERVRRALGEVGVGAEIETLLRGPRLTRYILRLHGPSDLDRLTRELDKIPFELGTRQTVSVAPADGERRVALDVPRPEREWTPVEGGLIPGWVKGQPGGLPVCPGVDVLGEPLIFDLAEAPHLFVAGTTGSGKSVCVHALLVSLLANGQKPQLCLIDPKEVEFAAYGGHPQLYGGKIYTEAGDAQEVLASIVQEMEQRQKELSALGVTNLAEAQGRGSDLRRLVVVVDELADLFLQMPEIEQSLVRLAQKARAVGIHLILSTQRPGSDTFPGLLRSNVPSRIALTVRTSQESRIILDQVGAEKLLMRGDMLVRLAGRETIRAHGARLEQGDIRALL